MFANAGITPWIGIPAAGVVGALSGLLIGAITFRLRGHYFALAMLAYPLAVLYIFEWAGYQEVSFPMKRENPAAYMQFADQRINALIALVMLIGVMLISIRIERSRFGLSLLAIKQNEIAAEASGINSLYWKLRAIAISGAIAGICGGLYSVVLLIVTPQTVFGMPVSAQALIVTMFGGVGTVWGPVIGAAVLVPLAEILHGELGAQAARRAGRRVRPRHHHRHHPHAARGIVWALRDRYFKPAAAARGAIEAIAAPSVVPVAPKDAIDLSTSATCPRTSAASRRWPTSRCRSASARSSASSARTAPARPRCSMCSTASSRPTRVTSTSTAQICAGCVRARICKLGVGRTFQVARPFPRMSLLENVVIGGFVNAATDADAREHRDRRARGALASQPRPRPRPANSPTMSCA